MAKMMAKAKVHVSLGYSFLMSEPCSYVGTERVLISTLFDTAEAVIHKGCAPPLLRSS